MNTGWVIAAALAIGLLCWMRLVLFDGNLATPSPRRCTTDSHTPPPALCVVPAT
ncbi:hypothetical protein [Mycobacterium simiae]|uniref:hypothetical protein n=1 Tax=Mycobacterium simiae TaxID=1784 RepID=UPI00165F4292|nr:hypothetical protein [Mycobacterium simiae]